MHLRLLRAAAGGLLATLLLAGCGATQPATPSAATCNEAPVLDDTTASVAVLGETGEAVEGYARDVERVLDGAEDMGARVLVNGVADTGTAPDLVANVRLTGDGVNDVQRKSNLRCKRELLADAVDGTLASAAPPTALDVFGSLLTLQGNLAGAPAGGEVDVVLMTSLLNHAAPVDLGDPAVLADPVTALNILAAQQLMIRCPGWRVYAVGGDRATPPIDNATRAQLREFWRQYFARCGGELVTWTDHLDRFPLTSAEIPAADTAQLPVQTTPDAVIATLGDVLFDPGSSELRVSAAPQLEQLLVLTTQGTGSIDITGHTDTGGDEDDNHRLSVARATAVAGWLTAHGVQPARIHTHGAGSSDPVHPSPTTTEQHQANRRVIVVLAKRAG